jgi:phytoene dehydrogenase-like protein
MVRGQHVGLAERAFRTFIKNVYLCSSCVVGGGGIARGSSYNCYKVIAEDFGLRQPD